VRYFEQARSSLPNSSQIPAALAYVMRRRGQWQRSEAYFNEAERLGPRDTEALSEHAYSYIALRRFPEALRKLEQVLDITPDDVDALALKAAIAQAEGDLTHASMLLSPLHPNPEDTRVLEIQVYQAILERRPAPMIARLRNILSLIGVVALWGTAFLVRLAQKSRRPGRCGNLAAARTELEPFVTYAGLSLVETSP
jgi:Flp pilus assembly protein TadD